MSLVCRDSRVKAIVRRLGLISFAVAILAVSPVRGQGRPVPVTDHDTPVQLMGFRIKPPTGSDWFWGLRDAQNVFFGKRLDSKTHSFVAVAFSRATSTSPSPDEFLEFARKFKAGAVDPSRNTIIEEEFVQSSTPAPECVRYRFKLEDRGAPFAKGVALLQEEFGFICLHPQSRKHFVDVRYSERGGPQPVSAQMREEGEAFLRGIEFTPVN